MKANCKYNHPELRDAVIARAETQLALRYEPRAYKPDFAWDCGTLIHYVYKGIGVPVKPFPFDYPSDWAMHVEDNRYLDFISEYVTEVRHAIRGGITVWKYGRSFCHGTICKDRAYAIHAYGRSGFGCTQTSHKNFFRKKDGSFRDCKHFDLKPEIWEALEG